MAKWKVPVAFTLVILLPVVLAVLILRQGWYEPGARNKGQWLSRDIYLLPPLSPNHAKWRLVYLAARPCEGQCLQVPVLMQRIQRALGRNLGQLELVQLASELRPETRPEIKGVEVMQELMSDIKEEEIRPEIKGGGVMPERISEIKVGSMMLVDPQGLAILRYEVPASTAEWPLFGKAVLSDLQQLLKYRRGPE